MPGSRAGTDLGVRLNLKPAITQMAFASKRIDGRGVVRPDFFLLCIVAYAHTNMVVACSAGMRMRMYERRVGRDAKGGARTTIC